MTKHTAIPPFDSKEFARKFHYTGNDLGFRYTPKATAFRVWAPTAESVDLLLYQTDHSSEDPFVLPMNPSVKGTWALTIKGDIRNQFYLFRLTHPGSSEPVEAIDPYAVSACANGARAMVVHLPDTHPKGWDKDARPAFSGEPTDAVVYEVHVRDFTIHRTSGSRQPGTYAGFAKRHTQSPDGLSTGTCHLRKLGVTHVHLLPVADFGGVDETKPGNRYNWGYNPENYNIPEGSYATNPHDGRVRVREFKEMVQGLHKAGLRVILDVVYNHTHHGGESHFHRLVPNYYHRQNPDGTFSNGSGCGNEVASERAMVRKMIIDSLVYWATEYHIDGFRFDLMGLHDLRTMRDIRKAMDQIDPSILLYGEGWVASDTPLPPEDRATKTNVRKLKRIAAFNDTLRDAVKGSVSDPAGAGFIQNAPGFEERIKTGITASVRHPQIAYPGGDTWNGTWAAQPHHAVSYNSCHDNHALWDKLLLTTEGLKDADRVAMNRLAAALVLTSQGIAFLHAGEEFARTKKKHENTYNLPDSVNAIDWSRKKRYAALFDYYRGLVILRKTYAAFRLQAAADIRRCIRFLDMPAPGMVGYTVKNPDDGSNVQTFAVLFNATPETQQVALPADKWRVLVDHQKAGITRIRPLAGNMADIAPRSALVLAK